MAEPTITSVSAIAAVPVLTAFGVSLGLNPGVLIAGAFGSFVAMVLLNIAPEEATLLRTILRRFAVLFASSMTAGYLTPLMMAATTLGEAVQFGSAFVIGGSAQWVLLAFIKRFVRKAEND